MLTVNWDKFNYYIDSQVRDDLTWENVIYKKLVWTKTKQEIERWLMFANASLVNENNTHSEKLVSINNNIALRQGLVDEAESLT